MEVVDNHGIYFPFFQRQQQGSSVIQLIKLIFSTIQTSHLSFFAERQNTYLTCIASDTYNFPCGNIYSKKIVPPSCIEVRNRRFSSKQLKICAISVPKPLPTCSSVKLPLISPLPFFNISLRPEESLLAQRPVEKFGLVLFYCFCQ